MSRFDCALTSAISARRHDANTVIYQLSWFALLVLFLPTSLWAQQQSTARELYAQAASSIQQRDFSGAIKPLHELVAKHPEFELRGTAVVYLAEAYIRVQQPAKGYSLLHSLLQTTAVESKTNSNPIELKPELRKRSLQLMQYAARASAIEAERNQDLQTAIQWANASYELTSDGEQKASFDELKRLALKFILASATSAEQTNLQAQEVVKIAPILRSELPIFKLTAAEQLNASKKTAEALKLYDVLAASGNPESANRAQASPTWMSIVALRRAGILLKRKEYAASRQICEVAKQRFPSSREFHEFNFILARIGIAQIEFEEALRVLAEVQETGQGGEQSKAAFMVGEVYFLKRSYPKAIESYDLVLASKKSSWTDDARLQRAKCLELSGDWAGALQAYEAIREKSDPTSVQLAEKRIAVLNQALSERALIR
ncbi:MAG: tetratricopeptide repeat protein [Planctomycetota bacterium]